MMLNSTYRPLPSSPEFDRKKSLRGGGGVSRSETEGVNNTVTGETGNQSLFLTRILLRLSLLLIVIFTGIVLVIHARPYDDSELRAFLAPPEGCPAPCWQGIRPGLTTAEEAVQILQAQQWEVAGFDLEHADFWAECSKGNYWCDILASDKGLIRRIDLHSSDLKLGEIRMLVGDPDKWFIYETRESFFIPVHATYSKLGFTVGIGLYICDFTPTNFWDYDTINIVTVQIGERAPIYTVSNTLAKSTQLNNESWAAQLYKMNYCKDRR